MSRHGFFLVVTGLVVPGFSMSRQNFSVSRQGFLKGRILPIATKYFMLRQGVAKWRGKCCDIAVLCRDCVGQARSFMSR